MTQMDPLMILSVIIAALAMAIATLGDLKKAGYLWLGIAAVVYLFLVGGVRSLEHGTLPLSLVVWIAELGRGAFSPLMIAGQVRAALLWAALLIPLQFGYLMYVLATRQAQRQKAR